MDNVILDVVLGLVLIYLVMALLVSKVQEVWVGQLRAGRTFHLHRMLLQAVGLDEELKKRVLNNPSIFALSSGKEPGEQRGGWLGTASGPSAIPPDLFARALLAELFDDKKHNHPSVRFNSPDAFVAEMGSGKSDRIWGTLRGLLAGTEGNWPRFEAAVANWYKAIGERADGWYQRSAQTYSFWIAFALAAMLNVDTFHLADRLANEPELRRSLSTVAQNVQALVTQERAQERGEAARELTAPAASLPPDRRAEQALNQAAALITSTYFRNGDVASFDPNAAELSSSQSQKSKSGSSTEQRKGTALIKECVNATMDQAQITNSAEVRKGKIYLSNPINWVYLLPTLQAELRSLRNPERAGVSSDWSAIHDCLANLSGWVALTAQRPSKDSAAQDNLRQAATELNRAGDALLELLQDRAGQASFAQLFLIDPKSFQRCSEDGTTGKEGLRRCVLASQTGLISLPLGWTEANRRLSFCHVNHLPPGEPPPAESGLDLCGSTRYFAGNRALQIRPMIIVGPGWFEWLAFGIGLFVTAFFVALGAPFWFDLLGRVVKLRAAGSKARDDALTSPPGPQGGGSGAADADAKPSSEGTAAAPFSLARNDIERGLTANERIALQGALRVERTGEWDKPTRQQMAIENSKLGLGSLDELTHQLFVSLLGRSPAGFAPFQAPSSGLKLHAADSRCGPAASALMVALDFPSRIDPLPTTMDDELRALAVLWRYKSQAATEPVPHRRPVKARADRKHDLDDIDPAELANILALSASSPPTKLPRETPAWLDWALGELGQAEAGDGTTPTTVAASNARILQYLAAAGFPNSPESTPWCAAFATWVLTRHNASLTAGQTPAAVPSQDRALAASFGSPAGRPFGTAVWAQGGPVAWPTGVLPGDVVTFRLAQGTRGLKSGQQGVNHVGFVLEVDASGTWVLSGNFSNRVGIDHFPVASIDEVRRP